MVSSPQHEPTMEEILASIRKIISEDSTEQQPAAEAQPAPMPEPAAEPEADILELTQEVAEEAPVTPPPAPPPPPPAPEPVAAVPEQDVVFQPIDEPAPAPAPAATHHDIFSDKTRQSIDDVFAAIDEDEEPEEVLAAPASAPHVASSATGASVEAVFEHAVRTSFVPVTKEWLGENADELVAKMKPLIREWMDDHFPALLEMAVREEVARVAKARGSKR